MGNRYFFFLFLSIFLFNVPASLAQKEKKVSLWKSLNTPTPTDSSADDYYGSNAIRYEDYVYKKILKLLS